MTRKFYPPRSKQEFYDLAIKAHMCTACLFNRPLTWKEQCPKCGAPQSMREFFPSKAEMNRAAGLILMQRTGRIERLRFHPRFDLMVAGRKICTYEADADYYENGKYIVEDTKPGDDIPSKESALKIALFNALNAKNGIEVRIYSAS